MEGALLALFEASGTPEERQAEAEGLPGGLL
jgi:hypothetical protein